MARTSDKKKTKGVKKNATQESKPENETKKTKRAPRQDLPDPNSIIDEMSFTSPKGNTYRIIVTNERDPYDKPVDPPKKRRKRSN